jgi:predicted ester cyclase
MSRLVAVFILAQASVCCAPAAAREDARSAIMSTPNSALEPNPDPITTSEHHRRTVRSIYAHVINERKLELLWDYVSPDYVGPRGARGPSGFAHTIQGLVAGVPDIRFELKEVFAGEESAAVRWLWSGHHTGTLFGLAPSNRQVTNSGIALYTFADGKIVSSVVETDRLGLLQQMGVVSPDLGAPRVAR